MSSKVAAGPEVAGRVRFDPDRLAYLEIAGLRAYYDHQWFRAFQLIIELMHEQFGLSWVRSMQASYYVVRAMLAWAPKVADKRTTHRYIRKFYRLAATYGRGAAFDPVQAGNREYIYWDLHRKRGINPDSDVEPYVECLARLHTVIFGVGPEEATKSAVLRAQATDYVDRITGKRSLDVDVDWRRAEARLREAYRAVVV